MTQYAARYTFMVLDADRDGLVGVEELLRLELFASYGQAVVERIHSHFDYASGFHGHLNIDDFCRLCALTEDRESKRSQAFWFRIVDVDGDGVLSVHDMRWLYDQIWKDEATCVSFEDLVCQVFDMARKPPPWRSSAGGKHISSLGGEGVDGGVHGGFDAGVDGGVNGGGTGGGSYDPRGFGRGLGARGGADGVTLSEIRKSKLASGIFGILTNHNDMLLKRSTAEFSKSSDVPM